MGRRAGDFHTGERGGYGEWLGKRYKDKRIIWILGGDRPVENDTHREIIRAMARACERATAARISSRFIRPAGTVPRRGSTTKSGWISTCGRTVTS